MTLVSLKFYPNKEKKSKKDDRIPIYMRIINKGRKAECRLQHSVSENDLLLWNPKSQRFENTTSPINKYLNKYSTKFDELTFMCGHELPDLSPAEILARIIPKQSNANNENSVRDFISLKYTSVILTNKNITDGTKKNYAKAVKHFTNYLSIMNQAGLKFQNIPLNLAEGFMEYLLKENPALKKKPMTEVSASGNIKKIKPLFDIAVKSGLILRNPFTGFKLKTRSPKKDKLNSKQVLAIQKFNWNNPTIQLHVDIFLFSIYTGLAYSDAMNLRTSDLQIWDKNETFFHIKRGKTGIDVRQFLPKQAKAIIKKYKTHPLVENTGRLLPFTVNQVYNRWLKMIAPTVGIPIKLTTHTGRHTFRVLLNEARIVDASVRKTMLGHSLHTDIDGVYNEVSEQQLLEAKKLYESFLSKLLK